MTTTLIALGAIALVAFAVEGALGFGSTVLVVSLGAQLVPLDVLLPAFVPLNLVLSSWLLSRGLRTVAWRLLFVEVAPAVGVGAAVGLAMFHVPGRRWLIVVFAVFVVALATLELVRPATKELGRRTRVVLLVIGGMVHGLFGTGGPVIVYVVRRRLAEKLAFRSTLAMLWLVLNVALLTNFASAGLYVAPVGTVAVALACAIVPGLVVGQRAHDRLDPARFERVVWWVLLVAGLALGAKSSINLLT